MPIIVSFMSSNSVHSGIYTKQICRTLCIIINELEFVFYVKTDVSPFLHACPKYASKSYSSCASHILSFCFISVPSFIEISLTVFKL